MAVELREFSSSDADGVHQIWQNSLQHEGFDPYSTLTRSIDEPHIVATIGDRIVGCSDMRSWNEGDMCVYLINGVVDPEHRNAGIATQMLTEMERRVRGMHQGASPAVLAGNATSTNPGARGLLVQNDYREVFSMVEMQLDAKPTVSPPLSFDVREPRVDELAKLQELNALAYRGRQFSSTEIESLDEFIGGATDLHLWVSAWDGDIPVGFVMVQRRDHFYEIREVTTHPDFRRLGIARHLLSVALQNCDGAVRLHTNGENVSGARGLYESLGFNEVRTHFRYRKPLL